MVFKLQQPSVWAEPIPEQQPAYTWQQPQQPQATPEALISWASSYAPPLQGPLPAYFPPLQWPPPSFAEFVSYLQHSQRATPAPSTWPSPR